jgi:hypothetical protein
MLWGIARLKKLLKKSSWVWLCGLKSAGEVNNKGLNRTTEVAP